MVSGCACGGVVSGYVVILVYGLDVRAFVCMCEYHLFIYTI